MPRAQIVNSIEDLHIEWATNFAGRSIRDFLISTKGFSERQYRYIMQRSPALEWNSRREEIQNNLTAVKIQKFTEDAVETHARFLKAANLALQKSVQFLLNHEVVPTQGKRTMSAKELLDCTKTIESAQQVFLRAMGVQDGAGLIQVYEEINQRMAESRVQTETSDSNPLHQLTYEQVIELIEMKRSRKPAASLQTELS